MKQFWSATNFRFGLADLISKIDVFRMIRASGNAAWLR
jgi:hypothetical protein